MGVGAAIVLVIATLVCAVVVSMMAGRGRVDVVALPTGGVSAAAGASGASGADGSAGAGSAGSGAPGTGASGSGGSADGSSSAATGSPGSAANPASTGRAAAPILVHVLGAVAHPGLFELHPGDRVIDAVSAAGGFTATADQGQQNLARVLADGEQLVVPEQGACSPPRPAGGGGAVTGPGTGAAAGAGGAPVALVNVNTADQATLETLPHVGPAMAQRIIAWRTENGRFTQVDDLKNVSGIGDKTFEVLAPLVTV
ncbi:hypothetical protein B7R22_05975 [Subtercola boreus]|uniref:Helix-hairpin-helix DNA-binding motif class 1 domain-containing protein n=1 Tax=Subtercola boreus TaxID=120213 RepID=A0A3E0W2G3_9MICO|nr:hypothetical protein B7R22_05975 [Subtercola boreus]